MSFYGAHSAGVTCLQHSWFFWLVAVVGLMLILVGLVLDGLSELTALPLFFAFYGSSLCGGTLGVMLFWRSVRGRWTQLGLLLVAALVWRIAYFPTLVLAGWIATWYEWIFFALQAPLSVVYPFFLLAMFGLNALASAAAVTVMHRRNWPVMIGALPLFALAMLVSFNTQADLTLLPDKTIPRSIRVLPPILPQGNVYLEALQSKHYNLAQRTLAYSGRVLYPLVPSAPWSATAKAVIAYGFRTNPRGSSADRIREHYTAFLSAHPCIRRSAKCPAVGKLEKNER